MYAAFSNAPTFTTDELDAFAKALSARPGEPFAAAEIVFPSEPGKAMMLAPYATSPYVLARCRELIEEDGWATKIPGRDELAFRVLAIVDEKNNSGDFAHNMRSRLDGMRLFAEIMGYISKPGMTVNQNNITNKVMYVESHGKTEDEWEAKLIDQQRKLTDVKSVN